MHLKTGNHTTLQLDGFVIRKRGVIITKYCISSGTIFVIKPIPYALAIDKCTSLVEYPVGLLCCNLLLHAHQEA